jgi:hypothetical protein
MKIEPSLRQEESLGGNGTMTTMVATHKNNTLIVIIHLYLAHGK